MSESEETYRKVFASLNEENKDYVRRLLTVSLIAFKEEKTKWKKEKHTFEMSLIHIENEIDRCNYHIGSIKKIMIEMGWTFVEKRKRKGEQ